MIFERSRALPVARIRRWSAIIGPPVLAAIGSSNDGSPLRSGPLRREAHNAARQVHRSSRDHPRQTGCRPLPTLSAQCPEPASSGHSKRRGRSVSPPQREGHCGDLPKEKNGTNSPGCFARTGRILFARKREITDRDRPLLGPDPVPMGEGMELLDIAQRPAGVLFYPCPKPRLQRTVAKLEWSGGQCVRVANS